MENKNNDLNLINKPLSFHKEQAKRSEAFSEKYAKKFGLSVEDLRKLNDLKKNN